MDYLDFVVSIERDGPGAFRTFVPPFPLEGMADLLGGLGPDVQSG